jgi:hypothetical protein
VPITQRQLVAGQTGQSSISLVGHLRLYTKGSFGAFHRGQKAERWSQEQFAAGRLAARKLQRDGKKDRMAAD